MFPNTASTDTAMDTTANPPLRKSQRKRQTNKKFTYSENSEAILKLILSSESSSMFIGPPAHEATQVLPDAEPKIKFKPGYYMECLYKNKFYVARVVQVEQDDSHFIIEIDHHTPEKSIHLIFYTDLNNTTTTSSTSHILFPCKWCTHNNLYIEPPRDWPVAKPFDWDVYMSGKSKDELNYQTQFTDLPLFNWSRSLAQLSDKFQLGNYLECVADERTGLVCMAQIKAKIGHLVFLKLMSNSEWQVSEMALILPVDSLDLYPSGWCEMNNFSAVSTNQTWVMPIFCLV